MALIFLIYMNMLPTVIDDGALPKYADGATSNRSSVESTNKLNHQLQLFLGWKITGCKLCQKIHCRKYGSVLLDVRTLSHFQISRVKRITFVRPKRNILVWCLIDSQLKWWEQFANVCKKMPCYIPLVTAIYTYKKELPDSIIKLCLCHLVYIIYILAVCGHSLL